jgi:hypothetical protein
MAALAATLLALDERVRERAWQAYARGVDGGFSQMADLVANLGDALTIAMRNQTVAQAPMLLFVVLAGLLVGLMLRT